MLREFLAFRKERKRVAALPPKFLIRYERADGEFREINLRAVSAEAAEAIAATRLAEQFGPWPVYVTNDDGLRIQVDGSYEYPHGPEVGQDNYQHKSTVLVDR